MKYIVKINKISPKGTSIIDRLDSMYQFMETQEILNSVLPYTKIFEKVVVKNFFSLSADLLTRLAHQYVHGAEICIETPLKGVKISLRYAKPQEFRGYHYVPLDLTAPISKSLAEFCFMFKGKLTRYVDAIKDSEVKPYFIPNEIWVALDAYSQQQIDKCKELNKGYYPAIEEFFKDVCKKTYNKIRVYSPNKKTFYEATAELEFERQCENCRLKPNEKPLTDEEIRFLQKYARIYGVSIPQFMWKYNTHKTEHGYTQEPERVYQQMSTYDISRVVFDSRNYKKGTLLPGFVRRGLQVQSIDNDKLLLDAFKQLKWIIKHMGDEALMPHYHRCPICGIYHDHDGCECGANPPIEEVQANNLFYGESSSYEDYDETISAYEDLTEEFDELFE